jgi:hypothetical protein
MPPFGRSSTTNSTRSQPGDYLLLLLVDDTSDNNGRRVDKI